MPAHFRSPLCSLFLPVITLVIPLQFFSRSTGAEERPNILWIVQEDASPWLGCYGYEANQGKTPVIDQLAKEGVLFRRAYVPAPVCSSCRSAFIVGSYQFRFGAHEHRSRRGKAGKPLSKGMKTIPELFVEAGYDTFNLGKTDYNFTTPSTIYTTSKKDWYRPGKNKPFFGQIQLRGGKTNTRNWPKNKSTNPKDVTVPDDYPQNEMFRKIVAQHCDTLRSDDEVIGNILKQLDDHDLADSTIVVYFSDHGANNLVRHKQMPTEAGLHVPLIIRGPRKWVVSGVERNDLVSILDVSATTLSWAGIEHPRWMEGQNLFGEDFKPRDFVGSGRDRCDHTIEHVRTIRTDRYRYTKNFLTDRVLLQPQYRDPRDYVIFLRKAYADGTLSPKLTEIYFGERPAEELYNIQHDPAQVNNLANSPEHRSVLEEHRKILNSWLAKGDLGADVEPDIELEMNGNGRFKGVNPEYERVRTDSDGDGLSDRWERYNNRDPKDGKLQFEFDCGGWQTEGWTTSGDTNNIAGRQGFLEFNLLAKEVSLQRNGLKLDAEKNKGKLAIRVRCNSKTEMILRANGKKAGSTLLDGDDQFATTVIELNENWNGTIESLQFDLFAPINTLIEIDWMRMR